MGVGSLTFSNESFTSSETSKKSNEFIRNKSSLKKSISRFTTKVLAVLSMSLGSNSLEGNKAPDQDGFNNQYTKVNELYDSSKSSLENYYDQQLDNYSLPVRGLKGGINNGRTTFTLKEDNKLNGFGEQTGYDITLNPENISKKSKSLGVNEEIFYNSVFANENGAVKLNSIIESLNLSTSLKRDVTLLEMSGELQTFNYLLTELDLNTEDTLIVFLRFIANYEKNNDYSLLKSTSEKYFSRNFSGVKYTNNNLKLLAKYLIKNKGSNSEEYLNRLNSLKNGMKGFIKGFDNDFYAILNKKSGNNELSKVLKNKGIFDSDFDEGFMTTINYTNPEENFGNYYS